MGVDPGLIITGYGVIEFMGTTPSLLEGGVIHGGSADNPLEGRLLAIYQGIVGVLQEFRPEALALEELYSHYAHPTTGILMGHARGVICLAAAKCNIPVFSYAASQVKNSLVGSGRARKEQMQRAIRTRLHLEELPEPADVADALAVALCHYSTLSSPIANMVGSKKR